MPEQNLSRTFEKQALGLLDEIIHVRGKEVGMELMHSYHIHPTETGVLKALSCGAL